MTLHPCLCCLRCCVCPQASGRRWVGADAAAGAATVAGAGARVGGAAAGEAGAAAATAAEVRESAWLW